MSGRHAVIFYGGFLSRTGGAFMHARTLADALEALGWRVTVVTLDSLAFPLRFLPHLFERIVNAFRPPLGFYFKGRLTGLLYRWMGCADADLIVFEDIYIAWNAKRPAITILHAAWSDNLQAFEVRPASVQLLVRLEAKRISDLEHPVATVSQPYRDFLRDRLFAEAPLAKRLDVIELGLDLRHFPVRDTVRPARSLIYCGTLEARKNVGFLLEVFRLVAARDPAASLTILGDGPERAALQRFAVDHGLKVEFRGRVPHDDVLDALRSHSIYVHTSVKESFSFALLEAKLCGLSTCALASLEVPKEFIDIAFASFNAAEWAEAILRVEGSPSLAAFPDFSAERMARRTLALAGVLPQAGGASNAAAAMSPQRR